MEAENQEGVLDDTRSEDPPIISVDDDELMEEAVDEERVSLLEMVKELQKKVSDMEAQMKESDDRKKSRRNLRAPSRHNINNRKSALATNTTLVMTPTVDEEDEGYDSDSTVGIEEERTLPNNTFSFLLMARYPLIERKTAEETDAIIDEDCQIQENSNTRSSVSAKASRSKDYLCLPFWLGILILILQVTIYGLVLQNSTDFDDSDNPFAFPTNVDTSTRAAELIAVLITVYTQNNIFQGVDLFVQSFEHIGKKPGVTLWKYYTAATTQVVVGMFGIFVTFIIIMQAEEVVDLLLDFTAMEFVAALDDAAFILSLRGFLGRPMKIMARTVVDVRYRPKDKNKWLRKWPLLVVLLGLFSCYLVIRTSQDLRVFGDNQVYVQFHDEAIPWLSSLSGSYFGCSLSMADRSELKATGNVGKIIYSKHPVKGCHDNWKRYHGAFFYCDKESWVFAVGADKNNPCEKWTLKSFSANPGNTDEYDLTSHSTEVWFARDSRNVSDDGVLEGVQFLPSFVPVEKPNLVCKVMEAKGVVFSFPFYELLEDIQINDRPVYFAGDSSSGEYIFYLGRRWVVVRESDMTLDCLAECGDAASILTCRADCLKSSFDPFLSNYTAHLISSPMDLRTTDDTWVPTEELQWNKATGHGSSSRPDVNRASLAEQIQKIPELLDSVADKVATPEQLAEVEALFAQSATLSCICHDSKEECDAYSCPAGEVKLLIDLKTDGWAEDNFFLVMGRDRWESIQAESRSVYNIDDWYENAEFASNFSPLNSTGFFPWQDVRNGTLENLEEYRYKTCVPENECGIIYLRDIFGDGIYYPGGLDVYYDGKSIDMSDEIDTTTVRHCVYQFGKSCDQSVQCSSGSFEFPTFKPQIDCEFGSVPLAFEVAVSDSSQNLRLSGFDYSWLEDDFPVNDEAGYFDWQRMQTPTDGNSTNFRYATCVPRDECAVLDTEYLFETLRVVYNDTEIDLSLDQSSMNYCFYQLGPACETKITCSDSKIKVPPPAVNCPAGGKSLAFNFLSDEYPSENTVFVTDLDSWNQSLWGDASTTLQETGYFDWGRFQIDFNAKQTSYLYTTCVPQDVCGVVALIDSVGDGVFDDGGISVFYDQEEIHTRNPGDGFSTCVFQFGACQSEAYCTGP